MCEYCQRKFKNILDYNLLRDDEDEYLEECDLWESVVIEKYGNVYELNMYTPRSNIAVQINYCPMCGRKLKKEDKK